MEPRKNHYTVDMDAFSDGQMRSKLWLCERLKKVVPQNQPQTVWIYGSWYGILGLLLLTRSEFSIHKICFFDIDVHALEVSRKVLNTWEIRGPTLRFHQMDCTQLNPLDNPFGEEPPDIIINTSCEHFENRTWLNPIPAGTLLVVQSTDMPHPTHIQKVSSLEEFKTQIPLQTTLFQGSLDFSYPNFSFFRFMLIGKK